MRVRRQRSVRGLPPTRNPLHPRAGTRTEDPEPRRRLPRHRKGAAESSPGAAGPVGQMARHRAGSSRKGGGRIARSHARAARHRVAGGKRGEYPTRQGRRAAHGAGGISADAEQQIEVANTAAHPHTAGGSVQILRPAVLQPVAHVVQQGHQASPDDRSPLPITRPQKRVHQPRAADAAQHLTGVYGRRLVPIWYRAAAHPLTIRQYAPATDNHQLPHLHPIPVAVRQGFLCSPTVIILYVHL